MGGGGGGEEEGGEGEEKEKEGREGGNDKKLVNLCFQGYGTILRSTSRQAMCNLAEVRGRRQRLTL